MIDGLTIESCDLGYNEILPLLQKVDGEFDPPFFKEVDMKQYAQKLQQYGHFIIAKVEDDLAGLAVYYRNDEEKYLYIPLFVCIKKYAGNRIGSLLLQKMREINLTFLHIRLQVLKSNDSALRFYQRNGFAVFGESDIRYMLEC